MDDEMKIKDGFIADILRVVAERYIQKKLGINVVLTNLDIHTTTRADGDHLVVVTTGVLNLTPDDLRRLLKV